MAKLRTYVHIDGEVYGPDDQVPDHVTARITNPKAWADESVDDEPSQAEEAGTFSGARLARHVHVDGQVYGPDDQVPDHIAARITNPKAWEGGKLPDLAAATSAQGDPDGAGQTPPETPPEKAAETPPDPPAAHKAAPPAALDGDPPADGPAAPPRSGRGSGLDAWAAYANARGVDVPAHATREAIIAACETAGLV